MIKFDLSDFSGDEDIESAIISFYIKGFSANAACSLHTLEKDFNVDEVTWDVAKSGVFWAQDEATAYKGKDGETIYRGGEYDPANVVSNPGATSITGEWESYDVTSIVKDMVSGNRDNYGFLLKTFYNNSMIKVYYACEAEVDSVRPKMEVTYKSTAISFGKNKGVAKLFNVDLVGKDLKIDIKQKGQYSVKLLTLAGKTIKKISVTEKSSQYINTVGLTNGVYLLNVSGEGQNFTRNIVLK